MTPDLHAHKYFGYAVGLFYALLMVAILPSTFDPVLLPRFIIISVFVSLFYLFILLKGDSDLQQSVVGMATTPLFILLSSFIIISALSLYNAINVEEGIFELTKLVVLALAFLGLYYFISAGSKNILIIIKSLAIGSTFILIHEMIQFYELREEHGVNRYLKDILASSTGAMGNRNLMASGSLLLIPFLLYGLTLVRKAWYFFLIVVITGLILNIIALQVRSVWVAAIVAGGVSIVCAYTFRPVKSLVAKYTLYSSKAFKTIALVLLAIVMLSWFAVSRMEDDTVSRFKDSLNLKVDLFEDQSDFSKRVMSSTIRLILWQKSMMMVQEQPLLGIGIGNWKLNLPKQGLEGFPHKANTGILHFQRPHNDYLWIMAETGLFGLLSYLSLLAVVAYYIRQLLKYPREPHHRTIGIVVLFSITFYLVFAFFSFPKERIFHNLVFITLIAWLASVISNNENKRQFSLARIWSKFFIITALFVSVACIATGYTRIVSDIHVKKAAQLKQNEDWNGLIREMDKVNTRWYPLDPVSTPANWYRGTARFHLQGAQAALKDFLLSYKAHPYHLPTLISLAACYELTGNHEEAIRLYKKAIAVSPWFNESYLNLSVVFYNQGRIDDAYLTLRACKTDEKNPVFLKTLNVVLSAKIRNLIKITPSDETKQALVRIVNDQNSLLRLHDLAVGNTRPIEDLIVEYAGREK
ncbi:MAG: O-antigen ligase family protein [Flavobacteriales bacterium]|nr:O-antigen ligase family protein [Flavobacteriales bacterium]